MANGRFGGHDILMSYKANWNNLEQAKIALSRKMAWTTWCDLKWRHQTWQLTWFEWLNSAFRVSADKNYADVIESYLFQLDELNISFLLIFTAL